MEVDAPQWKKEIVPKNAGDDYKRGVVCMMKFSEVRDSKEEACKALMDKVNGLIKQQMENQTFFKKSEGQQNSVQPNTAKPVQTAVVNNELKEKIEKTVYDSESVKQLSGETNQFPILALNDYVKTDSTLGRPIFTDDGVEEIDGTKNFIIKCSVNAVETRARASSKKQAKQIAAKVMIVALKNSGNTPMKKIQKI